MVFEKIFYSYLFEFEIVFYICRCIPKGKHRLIETTKRYARLADGNVGNFQM